MNSAFGLTVTARAAAGEAASSAARTSERREIRMEAPRGRSELGWRDDDGHRRGVHAGALIHLWHGTAADEQRRGSLAEIDAHGGARVKCCRRLAGLLRRHIADEELQRDRRTLWRDERGRQH